jgi:uncharacterized flavoprotein (TIGR03862 family)
LSDAFPSNDAAPSTRVAVIGGGPAGLMAAEVLAAQGVSVDLFDAMPSVGRKFLLAGRGGLNLTHSEDLPRFTTRFAERANALSASLEAFSPEALRAWAAELGVETFVGTSGRVFPKDLKAAPLLRAWMHRLRESGVRFHARHRWLGWNDAGALRLSTPQGEVTHTAQATILALGGASWARLGSDGSWVEPLAAHGADISPLKPSNCGFDIAPTAAGREGWSDVLRDKFAGLPIKPVVISFTADSGEVQSQQGEFVVTYTGIEGSLVYAFSARLRDRIVRDGSATITLDLLPSHTAEQVLAEVSRPRGPRSLSTHLKSRLGLQGLKMALLHELLSPDVLGNAPLLAKAIKALPLTVQAARPVDEAISTAGGVTFECLTEGLMLKQAPGVFCAGEMLDWEAPTGGYLLTASMATGRTAAREALSYLQGR